MDAFWAGDVRHEAEPKAWRLELGLSREGMERRAYRHMEASRHLAHHVTKALVMHQADEVFETSVSRHLFPDASGHRFGRPRVGRWWDYARIPGRARSHTVARKWETFRLHGTLTGHLDAYRHRNLDDAVATPEQAAALPPGVRVLEQPRRMAVPARPSGRIETGERTAKRAQDPGRDVVGPHRPPGRRRHRRLRRHARRPGPARAAAVGVWAVAAAAALPERPRYLAQDRPRTPSRRQRTRWLGIRSPPHGPHRRLRIPPTRARRKAAAGLDRVGGVDGNVSNPSVVSFPATFDPAAGPLEASRVELTDDEHAALAKARRKDRGRKKALDRSRRASNPGQYGPSKRQQARAERRQAGGLPVRAVEVPGGARAAGRSAKQAYRRDALSAGYRFNRARLAEAAATAAAAKDHRARRIAERTVAGHGANLVVEDCDRARGASAGPRCQ